MQFYKREFVKICKNKCYEKLFEPQDGTDNDSGEEWTMCVKSAEPHAAPQMMYAETAVNKQKSGKSTGHDQFPAKLMK